MFPSRYYHQKSFHTQVAGDNAPNKACYIENMRLRLRCISTGTLNGRYPLTLPAYLSCLLQDTLSAYAVGYLILGSASRLDAFSGYRIRTWLPGLCRWRDNRYTSGPSIPVLSY